MSTLALVKRKIDWWCVVSAEPPRRILVSDDALAGAPTILLGPRGGDMWVHPTDWQQMVSDLYALCAPARVDGLPTDEQMAEFVRCCEADPTCSGWSVFGIPVHFR